MKFLVAVIGVYLCMVMYGVIAGIVTNRRIEREERRRLLRRLNQ
jgi:hypothetical protein